MKRPSYREDLLEALEAELDECKAALHRASKEAHGLVPIEDIQQMLDAAGVPREENGRRLFIKARIQWLARRAEKE